VAGATIEPAGNGRTSFAGGATGLVQRHRRERWIGALLVLCSAVSIFTTIGIVAVLLYESAAFFREISPITFLTGTEWSPQFTSRQYGVLPLVTGSLVIAAIAAAVALPIGLAAAIYLSEYAHERARRILKPVLEILAGIPTVVYGYFALTFITPNVVQRFFPDANVFNGAAAGIVVGIMILPLVASVSEDAMSAVPGSLREAAYALGSTKLETALRVITPAALSGIVASFILAG
jgi:phosphate transport system permease protein